MPKIPIKGLSKELASKLSELGLDEISGNLSRLRSAASAKGFPLPESVHIQSTEGTGRMKIPKIKETKKPAIEKITGLTSPVSKILEPTNPVQKGVLKFTTKTLAGMHWSPDVFFYDRWDGFPKEVQAAVKNLSEIAFYKTTEAGGADIKPSVESLANYKIPGLEESALKGFTNSYFHYQKRMAGELPEADPKFPLMQTAVQNAQAYKGKLTGEEKGLSKYGFAELVSKKMRRFTSTTDFDPEVKAIIEHLRKNIYDPILEKAVKVGLVDKKVLENKKFVGNFVPQIWDQIEIRRKSNDYIDFLIRNHAANTKKSFEALTPEEAEQSFADATKTKNRILSSHDGFHRDYELSQGKKKHAKTREVIIHDSMLEEAEEKYLVNDIRIITTKYIKAMIPQTEFMERFGTLNLDKHMDAIDLAYQKKIKESPPGKQYAIETERVITKKYIQHSFDKIMGTAGIPDDPHSLLMLVNKALLTGAAVTKLGGVVITSFADECLQVAHNGLRPYARFIKDYVRHPVAMSKNRKELSDQANIAQFYLSQMYSQYASTETTSSFVHRFRRPTSMAEMKGSARDAVEIAIDKVGRIGGLMTLLGHWDHFNQTNVAITSANSLIRHALQKELGVPLEDKEVAWLEHIFVNAESDLEHVADMYRKYGDKSDTGLMFPNFALWEEHPELVERILVGLNRIAKDTVNYASSLSKPPWWDHPAAKVLTHFMNFPWTFPTKVLIPALQNPATSHILPALLFGTVLGATIYTIKEVLKGNDIKDVVKDKNKLLLEGVLRSGFLFMLERPNNLVTNLTGGDVGLHNLFGTDVPAGYSGRGYQAPNNYDPMWAISNILGPSVGTLNDSLKATNGMYTYFNDPSKFKPSQARAMRRLMFMQNHFLLGKMFDKMEEEMVDSAR